MCRLPQYTLKMRLPVILFATLAAAQQHVSLPTQDGGTIFADVYGRGGRGVVLAHGGQFHKESWKPQAETLTAAGFQVVAFDFRGFGQSTGPGQADVFTAPLHLDVLAAVRYLHEHGAKTVSVVGGSLGGGACADATTVAAPGEIDRLVELGNLTWNMPAEKIKGRKLFIVSRNDSDGAELRLPGMQKDYAKVAEPKQLIILEGNAHAQFLFQTDQSDRVMKEILRFLTEP
jgi:pimeloyl-ACP methyl ester carboxylesterase